MSWTDVVSRGRAVGLACLLAALLGAPAQAADVPAPAEPPAATATAPVANAEEVATVLRRMADSLGDESQFDELEQQVHAKTSAIGQRWALTEQILASNPRPIVVASLENAWGRERTGLAAISDDIQRRAHRRDANVATLDRLRATWTRSLETAQKSGAPDAIVQRAQATLAAIDATRGPVQQRRARVLVLEDEVSRALQTSEDSLDRIRSYQRMSMGRIFTDRVAPVWAIPPSAVANDTVAFRLAPDLKLADDDLIAYFRAHAGGFAFSFALFAALGLLLRAEHKRRRTAPEDDALTSAFLTPWATSLAVTTVVTRVVRPDPPPLLVQMVLIVGALAAARVLTPVVSKRVGRLLYAYAALFVGCVTFEVIDLGPLVLRAAQIAVLAAGAALSFALAAAMRGAMQSDERAAVRSAARVLLLLAGFAYLVAAGAYTVGYTAFGRWLGIGTIYASLTSIGLCAFRYAADELVALLLGHRPLSALRAIAQQRAVAARAIHAVLDLLVAVIWVSFVLYSFQILDPVRDFAQSLLHARLQVAELDFPVGRLVGFLVVAVASYFLTRLVVFLLEEDVYSRMELPRGVPYALSTITRYVLLLAGFLLALATLGLDLTKITVLVSAFGVGIGFGLQQIVNNFVSGLILLFERPVQVGDSIQLGDLSGVVERIGIRASKIRTGDGAEVILPNSKILDERVTNWTLSDLRRCIALEVTVAGKHDAGQIVDLLVGTARRDPRVLETPPPEGFLLRFGDADAQYELRVWTDEPRWNRLRSDLGIELQRALRALQEASAAGDAGATA